jgi:hypothetical protein
MSSSRDTENAGLSACEIARIQAHICNIRPLIHGATRTIQARNLRAYVIC